MKQLFLLPEPTLKHQEQEKRFLLNLRTQVANTGKKAWNSSQNLFLIMDGGGENYSWWEEQEETSVSITSQGTHLQAAHLELMPRYSNLKVFINDPDPFLLLPPEQIKQWVIYSKPDCQELPAFNYHGVSEAWRVLSDITQKDSLIKKLRSLHFLLQFLLVLLTHNSNYNRQKSSNTEEVKLRNLGWNLNWA